jgi:hypothetical protein
MKKFREKINGNTFFVCSTHKDRFVHDTIKGWGRVSPSGKTVVWEGWRRPPNQKNKKTNPFDFSKIVMPMVDRVFPKLSIEDFIGTQPLCRPREENKS